MELQIEQLFSRTNSWSKGHEKSQKLCKMFAPLNDELLQHVVVCNILLKSALQQGGLFPEVLFSSKPVPGTLDQPCQQLLLPSGRVELVSQVRVLEAVVGVLGVKGSPVVRATVGI